MGFIDEIARKISKGTEIIGRKSGEMLEITKIKLDMASEKDKLEELYEEIGKAVYDTYKKGELQFPEVADKCKLIDDIHYRIRRLKQKIAEIKGGSICRDCGEVVSPTQRYCHQCGRKLEPVSTVVEDREGYKLEITNGVVCQDCGTLNEAGSQYCSSCGKKC